MNTLEIQLYTVMMVSIRASILMYFVPYFGGERLYGLLKVSIIFGIGWIVGSNVTLGVVPQNFVDCIIIALKESIVGFLMGLGAKIVFFCIEFGAGIIANEIGLAMSSTFDPLVSKNTTPVESLMSYFTIMIFLITGIHQEILLAFTKSFQYFPIGTEYTSIGLENLIKASSSIFFIGLQIAAPMIALNFMINMIFAVLGKAAPKINVFMISFSVRILAGISLMMGTVHLTLQYIQREVYLTPQRMLELLVF